MGQNSTGGESHNKPTIDSIFKIAIIIIGIAYLILSYNQSLNGRYMVMDRNEWTILNTRTGIVYCTVKGKDTIVLDQVKGIILFKPLEQQSNK